MNRGKDGNQGKALAFIAISSLRNSFGQFVWTKNYFFPSL
jgi:hypothetical protein